MVNYAGSTSAKDPVWKYKWVENNEPDVFKKVYKWLDIGDYLVGKCTGRIIRTADSAFATFLYDTRKGKEGWNQGLLKMYQVDPKQMPEIIDCTDLVGGLTGKAALDLGLAEGTPVFWGGGGYHLCQYRRRLRKPRRYPYLCGNIGMGVHISGSSDRGYQGHDHRGAFRK